MSLVDDDPELPTAMVIADLIQDERELLDRRDHDLLTFTQKPTQVTRSIRVTNNRSHLRKLPYRRVDLTVQHPTIRNHNHRIQNRITVPFQTDQLVCQPSDRVRLPATRRMLNQIPTTNPVSLDIRQQLPHHIQLMIPRPDLRTRLSTRLIVRALNNLRVVLDDLDQPVRRQHLFP